MLRARHVEGESERGTESEEVVPLNRFYVREGEEEAATFDSTPG